MMFQFGISKQNRHVIRASKLSVMIVKGEASVILCDFSKSARAVLLSLTLDKQKAITTLVSESNRIHKKCFCSFTLI